MIGGDAEEFDATAVLNYIIEKQQQPVTACAYLGTDAENIIGDLKILDQPWESTARVALDDSGNIIGVALIEWDTQLNRSEVYGPWASDITVALKLLSDVTAQAPVTYYVLYAPIENELMAEVAAISGYELGELSYSMELTPGSSTQPANNSVLVHPAADADLNSIQELHDAEFPDTYASAEDLLDPEEYQTLVAEMANKVVGYLTYQAGSSRVYIDFVAVAPTARRQGVARALFNTVQNIAGDKLIELTADSDDALVIWEALGFKCTDINRSYENE